jgi:hypothetical protein
MAQGPEDYSMDEGLMDELGGAMDEFDSKKLKPIVQITVSVDQGDKKEEEAEDGSMPTPEEMEELQQAMS